MKKVLLALGLLLISFVSMNAEEIKYQGEVDLGCGFIVSGFQQGKPVPNFRTIHGVKIGEYLFTGIGIGADWYLFDRGSDGDDSEAVVPVFADVKGYYPVNENFKPFVALDLGCGFGVSQSISGNSGFLFSPAVGIQYKKFQVQIGYQTNLDIKTCLVRVGVVF